MKYPYAVVGLASGLAAWTTWGDTFSPRAPFWWSVIAGSASAGALIGIGLDRLSRLRHVVLAVTLLGAAVGAAALGFQVWKTGWAFSIGAAFGAAHAVIALPVAIALWAAHRNLPRARPGSLNDLDRRTVWLVTI